MSIVAVVVLYSFVISPEMKIAKAKEIIENDPQVSEAIQLYELKMEGVKVEGDIAHVVFSLGDNHLTLSLQVDLEKGTVEDFLNKKKEILESIKIDFGNGDVSGDVLIIPKDSEPEHMDDADFE